MEKLVFCGKIAYRAQAILYEARGYEFPLILPPLPGSNVYGVTVYKQATALSEAVFSPMYPNPAQQKLSLDYQLPEGEVAQVKLYDLNGRTLLQNDLQGKGTLQWSVANLPIGVYYCQIQQQTNIITTQKVVVVR